MKLKQIALAIGVTLMATAAFAAPITPAQIGTAQSGGTLQKAWITGASAPTRVVYEGWVDGCDANTNAIFSSQTNTAFVPGSIGNFMAYACTRGGVASILFHTIDGGSLNAYAPHTVGTKLARMSLASIIATTSTPIAYSDASQPLNNANVYKNVGQVGSAQLTVGATCTPTVTNTTPPATCTGGTIGTANSGTVTQANYNNQQAATAAAISGDANGPQLPVGGFSDVEAALFPATLGGGNVSAKGVEAQANIGQVFGVAVSTNLYRAMQAKQGITSADANFDPALAPNITSQEYTAIIDNDGGSAYKQDWSLLAGVAGTGKKVIVARRVATSGTQAASNAFFLRAPCADAVAGSLVPATAGDSSPGVFEVTENSSTGNVKTQLTAANAAGNYAIGVMSVENDWALESATANPLANGYRWLKIDGIHPETATDFTVSPTTRGNARLPAVTGNYPFHMETRYFTANTATGFGAGIVTAIATKLGNPPTAAACNTVPRGLTLNPAGGSSCTVGTVVHKGSNGGNNCAPTKLFF